MTDQNVDDVYPPMDTLLTQLADHDLGTPRGIKLPGVLLNGKPLGAADKRPRVPTPPLIRDTHFLSEEVAHPNQTWDDQHEQDGQE